MTNEATIHEEEYGDEGDPRGYIRGRRITNVPIGDDGPEPEDDVVVWSSGTTTGVVAGNAADVLREKD